MIDYTKVKAGDTLKVTGAPHYDEHKNVAVDCGQIVMVDEVHPAGVTVKTKEGRLVPFHFAHGAEKLLYTPETHKAISSRENFGKAPRAAAGNGDYDTGFDMGRNGQALDPGASQAKKQGFLDGQATGSKKTDDYNAGFETGQKRQVLDPTASAEMKRGYTAGWSAGSRVPDGETGFQATLDSRTLEGRALAAKRTVEEQAEFEADGNVR